MLNHNQSHQYLHIRFACLDDVPTILTFIRELAEYEKLAHAVSATEDSLRTTLFGDRPAAEVLLAEYKKQPAGFALFFHNYSTFLGKAGIYLEDLYVKPECRGQSIGQALLACISNIARQRGCGRLEWSVLDWNQDAIRLYRKLGAVPLDDWTVFRLTGNALDELAASSITAI